MLTTSHAFWALRLPAAPGVRAWRTAGAISPDVPAIALVGVFLPGARGRARGDLFDRVYHRSPWREVHLALHSVLPALALRTVARRPGRARAYADGWLSHLAIDFVTHHDDAWPPAWPVSGWRWRSPVSYWQTEHHARTWAAAETAALVLATVTVDAPRDRAAAMLPIALAGLGVTRGVSRRRQAACERDPARTTTAVDA